MLIDVTSGKIISKKIVQGAVENVASLSNAYLAFSGKAPTTDRATMSVNLQNIMFTNENTRKATTIQFEDEMIYARNSVSPRISIYAVSYTHLSAVGIAVFAGAVSAMALSMTPLAKTGTDGAIAMGTFGVVVGGLVAVFAVFGTALTAAIPAMLAFGATILMVGAGTVSYTHLKQVGTGMF